MRTLGVKQQSKMPEYLSFFRNMVRFSRHPLLHPTNREFWKHLSGMLRSSWGYGFVSRWIHMWENMTNCRDFSGQAIDMETNSGLYSWRKELRTVVGLVSLHSWPIVIFGMGQHLHHQIQRMNILFIYPSEKKNKHGLREIDGNP